MKSDKLCKIISLSLATWMALISYKSGAADDKRVFYEARYTMVGFLTRASLVCGGDKHDFDVAFSLVNPDELKAFSRAFPETTKQWMLHGTNIFNTGVMKDGIPAACDFALKKLQEAKDIVQEDKQLKKH